MAVVRIQKEYQGVVVQDFEACLEQSKGDVLADVQRLERCMKERLEWSDTEMLRAILVFIDTENWQQRDLLGSDDGLSNIRTAVDKVLSIFLPPLEAKEMCAAVIEDEVEDILEHARTIGTESYRAIWYKLHTCPNSNKWPNILMLCELVFSLPFTTSRVEQIYSRLKVIKTKIRTSLHTTTLHDLLEIKVEGPPLSDFNADTAVTKWWGESTSRRVKHVHSSRCRYQLGGF